MISCVRRPVARSVARASSTWPVVCEVKLFFFFPFFVRCCSCAALCRAVCVCADVTAAAAVAVVAAQWRNCCAASASIGAPPPMPLLERVCRSATTTAHPKCAVSPFSGGGAGAGSGIDTTNERRCRRRRRPLGLFSRLLALRRRAFKRTFNESFQRRDKDH